MKTLKTGHPKDDRPMRLKEHEVFTANPADRSLCAAGDRHHFPGGLSVLLQRATGY